MIEVKNLKKYYGSKLALDNVSFCVKDGEILGFLGPNGAGKSTTMNIITGYISSNEGTVTIDGFEILKDPIKAKAKIGYLPEIPPLYLDMTVKEYLNFMYDLKKAKLDKKEHIQDICEKVQINDVMERLIKNLSKGYKQRVGLAQALIGNPKLLILDEPSVGLDPKQIIEIRNLIKDLKKEHTIILSSHVLSEIQSTCDRVLVINNGKIVADDTTENLSETMNNGITLIAKIEGEPSLVKDTLQNIDDVISIDAAQPQIDEDVFEYILNVKCNDVRKVIFKELARIDCPLIEIKNSDVSLEDVFMQLTSNDNNVENYNQDEAQDNTKDDNLENDNQHLDNDTKNGGDK